MGPKWTRFVVRGGRQTRPFPSFRDDDHSAIRDWKANARRPFDFACRSPSAFTKTSDNDLGFQNIEIWILVDHLLGVLSQREEDAEFHCQQF